MTKLNTTPIQTRPAYVVAHPPRAAEHRAAQKTMFGAANRAGLPTTGEAARDAQLDGINAAFGLRGSQRIVSRRQMTIEEMQAIAVACDAGLFDADWNWSADFTISRCEVVTETIPARTVLHFCPISDARTELYSL